MTHYELLKSAATICRILAVNKVKTADVCFVPLYDDYIRMKGEGHKMTYIVFYLSEKYCVSEAAVYRIVKRMGKDIRI